VAEDAGQRAERKVRRFIRRGPVPGAAAAAAEPAWASAMYAWQFAKLQTAAAACGWTGFVSMQNRYNLVNREDERELIPLCRDSGVGVVPYSPLARVALACSASRA
jgi:1-deoxyxylulose-5-phosphate synthase